MSNREPRGRKNPDKNTGANAEFLSGLIDRLRQRTSAAAENIAQLPPERQEPYRQRLLAAAERYTKRLICISGFALAAGTADYHATRYSVVETDANNDGVFEYEHQDPETTHIINMLAGKEEMTADDYQKYLADALYRVLQLPGINQDAIDTTIPIDKKNLEQLKADLRAIDRDPEAFIQNLNVFATPEYDAELYNALWKLEQANGNPKIRFQYIVDPNAGIQPHYVPMSNTMYLRTYFEQPPIDLYIAELSHSQQFHERPLQSTVSAILGSAQFVTDMVDLAMRPSDVAILYQQTGSPYNLVDWVYHRAYPLEVEAHGPIESQLHKDFDALTPSRVADREQARARMGTEVDELRATEAELKKQIKTKVDATNAKYYEIYHRDNGVYAAAHAKEIETALAVDQKEISDLERLLVGTNRKIDELQYQLLKRPHND